jgi:hypothetical protein
MKRSIQGVVACLGLAVASPQALAEMTVSFTTTQTPDDAAPRYAPANLVAVWVEDDQGTFVRTIDRKSAGFTLYLRAWAAASGGIGADTDAVSGATRLNQEGTIEATWNFRDKSGNEAPDGTYTLRMELADENAIGPDNNNQGSFTFVKGEVEEIQGPLTDGGFENVSINSQPGVGGETAGTIASDGNVVTGGCRAVGETGGSLALSFLLAALLVTRRRSTWH